MSDQPRQPGAADWIAVADRLPPEGEEVLTKINDDLCIARNEQTLRCKGRLWFFPDMSMYVYYEPTHWRSLQATTPAGEAGEGDFQGDEHGR